MSKTVLVAPDGREYVAGSEGEVTRLVRGYGYRVKPAAKKPTARKKPATAKAPAKTPAKTPASRKPATKK